MLLCHWTYKKDDRQWRQGQLERVRSTVLRHRDSRDCPAIPKTLTVVLAGVAVQHFAPHTAAWCPYVVLEPWYKRTIIHHQHGGGVRVPLPQEAQDQEA